MSLHRAPVRFLVEMTPQTLLITRHLGDRLLNWGCLWFGIAMISVMVMGFYAVMMALREGIDDSAGFLDPRRNHFGFFWMITSGLMLVSIPVYVVWAYRSRLTFRFDRTDNSFLRNGRRIGRLDRIECIRIRHEHDPDQNFSYRLIVEHGDGHQQVIDDSYDPMDVRPLAQILSDWLLVPLREEAEPAR
jgi:hypothetical protein